MSDAGSSSIPIPIPITSLTFFLISTGFAYVPESRFSFLVSSFPSYTTVSGFGFSFIPVGSTLETGWST